MNQQTNIIQARLVKHNITSGVSQSSGKEWTKHELVTETLEQNPKKIVFTKLGDIMSLIEGNDYTIEFYVESREYNGKWYTNVNIYSISLAAANVPIQQAQQQVRQQVQQNFSQQPQAVQQFASTTEEARQSQMDQRANAYFNSQPAPVNAAPAPQPEIDGLPF